MIIGITGRAGSGKDTVASIAQELYPETRWEIKGFADKLRQIAEILTGIPATSMKEQTVKEIDLGDEWDRPNEGFIYSQRMNLRTLLQKLGTDAIRDKLHPNAWVNALMCNYTNPHISEHVPGIGISKRYSLPNWLITDCRFPNEHQAITSRGGTCIRIVRPDNPYPQSNHISETALDDVELTTIINDGNLDQLKFRVQEIFDPIADRIHTGSIG